jgi:hypothetical protein
MSELKSINDTVLDAHAFAVYRVMGPEMSGYLQRVPGVVFAPSEQQAIRQARGPFNPSPVVQLVARGVL